jgi:hypothetical protein
LEQNPRWARWLFALFIGTFIFFSDITDGCKAIITLKYDGKPFGMTSATMHERGWGAAGIGLEEPLVGTVLIAILVVIVKHENSE